MSSTSAPARSAGRGVPPAGAKGGRGPARGTSHVGPARGGWRGVIEEYRDLLPVTADTPIITLREGATPLLPAPRISARARCDVYLKVEGANPTGSFKDRGMTVAISRALQ